MSIAEYLSIKRYIKSHLPSITIRQSQAQDRDKYGKQAFAHIANIMKEPAPEAMHTQLVPLLQNECILITGAAGSIGSELSKQIARLKPKLLVLVDKAETPLNNLRLHLQTSDSQANILFVLADITDYNRMRRIFEAYRPTYVLHAAAYKHVPMLEDNPQIGFLNNVLGTRTLADLAVLYGTLKFVMVSTDKAVNPSSVMGCTKRICEMYVQSIDKAIKNNKINGLTRFITTRFGNVIGSNGSVTPLFAEQIRKGGPVTVTHREITRYFMHISEAVKLVLQASLLGQGGEIFVFDMGEPVRIADVAEYMIAESGRNIDIIYTGLRAGEKLYEEVLDPKEIMSDTINPKIKKAKVRECEYTWIKEQIAEAIININTESNEETVRRMKYMVPEYLSCNSTYESLDLKHCQDALAR